MAKTAAKTGGRLETGQTGPSTTRNGDGYGQIEGQTVIGVASEEGRDTDENGATMETPNRDTKQ